MQVLFDLLAETFHSLWAHKLRTFLTMFGIAWGVGSLLLLVGLGEGFRTGNQRELNEIGENIVFIFPGIAPQVAGQHNNGKRYFLTDKDAADIAAESPDILRSSAVIQRNDVRAISAFQNFAPQLNGVSANYNLLRFLPLSKGRWLNQSDLDQHRDVIVLGEESRKQLFGEESAVGSFILLNGIRYQVIGTIALIGKDSNNGTNSKAFVPITSMRMNFPVTTESAPPDAISMINFTPVSRSEHTAARNEAHHVIARNHGFDEHNSEAFEEWDTVQSADTVGKIFTAMDMFLGSVGIVTLVLGAIGVINIMLVSVTERTQEIGLRKALGATSANILAQFCFEGAFLTIVSGLIGLGGSWAFMRLLHVVMQSPQGFDPPTIVPTSAVIAIGSLAVAGIFAGLYPARQAAKLAPIEALRRE